MATKNPSAMPLYRPVSTRLWNDRRFLELDDTGRLLWLYFLTAPSLPIPGVLIGGEAAVAENLGWTVERVREGFASITRKGIEVVWEGRILWLKNATRHQPIAGPNSMVAMARFFGELPEGDLKRDLYGVLATACKSWSKRFVQLFGPPRETLPGTLPETLSGTLPGTLPETLSHTNTNTNTNTPIPERAPDARAGARDPTVPALVLVPEPEAEPEPVPQPVQGPEPEPDPLEVPLPMPPPPPSPSMVLRAPPAGGERAKQIHAIVQEISQAHSQAFNALREELGEQVRPMAAMGDPAEAALRELLTSRATLDGALEDCRYVLEIRRAEAEKKRTLKYFGPSVWSPRSYGIARTMSVTDVTEIAVDAAGEPRKRAGPRGAELSNVERQAARARRLREEEQREAKRQGQGT